MTDFVKGYSIDGESSHLGLTRGSGFIDVHCHCLHGLDDGPRTMTESIELCRMLASEGIRTIVATPHQLGRFDASNEAGQVRRAVRDLTISLENNRISLQVLPGAEVRVDERIHELLEADRVLTLADGGRYVLLELPHEVFMDVEPLLVELSSMGIESILAHAERITALIARPSVLLRWLDYPTHLQITASSLSGDFGPDLQRVAWDLLSSGRANLVATDAHDLNVRRPRMKAAFESISAKLGEDLAHLVCIENPSRVIIGEELLPASIADQQEMTR
jgi:protein-tyrosine phosphatase